VASSEIKEKDRRCGLKRNKAKKVRKEVKKKGRKEV
jgi:hypothetical protein